jgi:hypothetical protein
MNFNRQIYCTNGVETVTYVDINQIDLLIKKDAHFLSTEQLSKFIGKNRLAYFVLVNTWLAQVDAVSNDACLLMRIAIVRAGVITAIRDCSNAADAIIRGYALDEDSDGYGYIRMLRAATTDLSVLLRLLRYPKRFCPIGADTIHASSLEAFLAKNAEMKTRNITDFPYWLVHDVRDVLHKILRNFSKYYDPEDGYFSSGATCDAGRRLKRKVYSYCLRHPSFGGVPFPTDYEAIGRWRNTSRLRQSVKLVPVPKSYKVSRIIAEEPAFTQFELLAAAKAVRECVKRNGYITMCDTTSQEQNRELARLGSIDGSYATIDLSSASDSISEALEKMVFPNDYLNVINSLRCAYVEGTYDGKHTIRRVMQMALTSGAGLTFDNESVLFLAIAIVATDYCRAFGVKNPKKPSVFGDDIIVDDRVAETAIQFLELLGFTVNHDKTFSSTQVDGYYRESCGEEFFNGIRVSSLYFPRKPIGNDADGLASLVSLEKRLYFNVRSRFFLTALIRNIEPRMTAHVVGENCSDLWDDFPVSKIVHKTIGNQNVDVSYYLAPITTLKYGKVRMPSGFYHDRMLDHWYYIQYLQHGPAYDTELDRLLGVSTSRKQYERDSLDSTTTWTYIAE